MAYDPEKVTLFAKTDARGKNLPFGIKAKDRARHVYVIGKTGMGKSTLLENMAVQDMQNGEGMAFIDPHGSTAETLLDFVPEHRVKDVLYFAPHDMENPISFNIMEDVGPDKRHLVVSGLMSVFAKIWVDQWSARMEYILSNTLLALLEYPDSTLLSVNKMLSDKKYRDKVVANVTDPSVKSFWVDEFAKYTDRFAAEATPAIQNKIGQFTANPVIRNIIGQPKSSFDIREMMDQKKIIIMNLSKGLIGETNANLLGSMLTTRIYLAAMSRADLPTHEMQQLPNFYFYVDEFQSFANATFSNILSEARKYKLNLTIAHQYIEQMEEEVRNAVFGNVGTIISFRVGPFDAEVLETVFAPQFSATDLVNLGFAQVYLTLMIDGVGSQPFSAVTLPPIEPPDNSTKEQVIASSSAAYGKSRAVVEEAVVAFHAPVPEEKKERSDSRNDRGGKGNSTSAAKRSEGSTHRREPRDTGDRGGRTNESRDERTTPSDAQRSRVPRNEGKSLDELRSTLRTIVDADTKKPNKNQDESRKKHDAKRDDRRKEKKEDSSDLKSALAQALAGADTAQKPEKAEVPAEPTPTAPPAPRAASPENPREEREDQVSAKELERMMRTNTSDKPPRT